MRATESMAGLHPDESRLGERTEFMTRAGRWCNGSTPPPVGGDPGSNPVASARESASDTVCGFLFAVLAQRLVPQPSKLMMRVRFPYTARYDSMPVGSSRRDVMTMRFVSDDPRLRLFDGHADIAGAHHSRMMRTAPVGGVGANPICPSAKCGQGFLSRNRLRLLSADPHDVETVSVEHGRHSP